MELTLKFKRTESYRSANNTLYYLYMLEFLNKLTIFFVQRIIMSWKQNENHRGFAYIVCDFDLKICMIILFEVAF